MGIECLETDSIFTSSVMLIVFSLVYNFPPNSPGYIITDKFRYYPDVLWIFAWVEDT